MATTAAHYYHWAGLNHSSLMPGNPDAYFLSDDSCTIRTDGQTDGQTNGWMDGWTDGQTIAVTLRLRFAARVNKGFNYRN